MKNNILEKISHYTKKKYKSFRNSVFLSIHGKITVSKKPPNTKIKYVRRVNLKDFFKYNYKFFEIENGRVFTDNTENVSIISENKLLDEFSYQQINGFLTKSSKNFVIKNGTPKILTKLKGNIAILAQGASGYNNYAHCLFDIVPKIKILFLSTNFKKIDYFYFSKLNKFQKQILKYMNIDEKKVIDSNIYRYVEGSKIMGVSHPNYFNGTISKAHSNMPAWIPYYLKKKFVKHGHSKINPIQIFIDRSDSKQKHCKLVNNSEIITYLKSKGFKILQLSKLNFNQQIDIFANAKIVISPHGAGLANLVFCKKNTNVIEIKPDNHPNKVYKKISSINKLKYKLIKLKHIKNNKKGDMFLNKTILNKYIK